MSRVPVVLRAIRRSLQTAEARVPGRLVIPYARCVQIDGDRLLQLVSIQDKQVSQVASQSLVLNLGVELAQEAAQVDVGDGLSSEDTATCKLVLNSTQICGMMVAYSKAPSRPATHP